MQRDYDQLVRKDVDKQNEKINDRVEKRRRSFLNRSALGTYAK